MMSMSIKLPEVCHIIIFKAALPYSMHKILYVIVSFDNSSSTALLHQTTTTFSFPPREDLRIEKLSFLCHTCSVMA